MFAVELKDTVMFDEPGIWTSLFPVLDELFEEIVIVWSLYDDGFLDKEDIASDLIVECLDEVFLFDRKCVRLVDLTTAMGRAGMFLEPDEMIYRRVLDEEWRVRSYDILHSSSMGGVV